MKPFFIEYHCFARELILRKSDAILSNDDSASVFLLREMLRQLYFINNELNKQKDENLFELFITKRLLGQTETEQILQFESQFNEMSFQKGGVYGNKLLTFYSRFEVCRINGIVGFPNPYEYAMIVLERGGIIDRETYPPSFYLYVNRIPINLTMYNSESPYLVCTETNYLNAIRNYYIKTGNHIETIAPWLQADNERGYISDAYKEWL